MISEALPAEVSIRIGRYGAGASGLQTLNDLDDWSNLLYDFRNVAGGAFDNIVPINVITQDIVNEGEATGEWYDGLLFHHTLTEDGTCPRIGEEEELCAEGNEIEYVGRVADVSFQIFTASPENDEPTIGPFIWDPEGIVMQKGFYSKLINGIEVEPDTSACAAGDTTLECNPIELEFVDVTGAGDPGEREVFLRIARLTADPLSADQGGFTSELIGPIHTHRDGVNGFYHVAVNTNLVLPLGGVEGVDEEPLPGAGTYVFDIIVVNSDGDEFLAIDNNQGGDFRLGQSIPFCGVGVPTCAENLSGYRLVDGETPATVIITILEDEPPE